MDARLYSGDTKSMPWVSLQNRSPSFSSAAVGLCACGCTRGMVTHSPRATAALMRCVGKRESLMLCVLLFFAGVLEGRLFSQEMPGAGEANVATESPVPPTEVDAELTADAEEQPVSTESNAASFESRVDALLADGDVFHKLDSVRKEIPGNSLGLLRRLYLDLLGVPPTLDEIDAFLARPAATRYAEEVALVLQRPEFIEHWTDQFDIFLLERRANTNISQEQWREWLRGKIEREEPIHEWMAELITADGSPGPNRPAVRFLLDRDVDPHLITRDIGRIYFGVDLQCAQCHDHPSVDTYYQSDYHGLLGFVASLSAVEIQDGDAKIKVIAEKALSEAPFESVFDRGQLRRVFPHVPFQAEVSQVWHSPSDEYHPPAAEGLPAVPKDSRRHQLAALVRSGSLTSFNETIANRLWALVFGRGAIHPVDFVHGESAPRHPALVAELAKGLADKGFRLKPFIQSLVLTDAYQSQGLPIRYEIDVLQNDEWVSQGWLVPGGNRPEWLGEIAGRARERLSELESQIDSLRARVEETEKGIEAAIEAMSVVHSERVTGLASVDTARTAVVQSLDARGKKDSEYQTAITALSAAKDRLAKFQTALDATSVALATVGEDAAVAEAAKVLQQRVAEATAAIGPAEQNTQKFAAELAAIDQQLIPQREALAVAQAAVDAINVRFRPLEQQLVEARRAHQNATQGLASVRREMEGMQAWVDCDEAFQGLADLQTHVATARQSLEAIEKLEATLVSTGGANQASESAQSTVPSLETWEGQSEYLGQTVAELQTVIDRIEKVRGKLVEQQAFAETQIRKQAETLARLEQVSGEQFSSSLLVPLTPIQVGWASLVTTGVFKNYVAKHLGELEKEAPAIPEQAADPAFLQARHLEAWKRARKELAGSVTPFVNLYAAAPGQPQGEFFATADQALFARNGGTLFAWSGPSGDNVTSRVIAAANVEEAAKLLYRGVLTREPTQREIDEVAAFLGQDPAVRPRLVQEMVWGLLASAEFRFRP